MMNNEIKMPANFAAIDENEISAAARSLGTKNSFVCTAAHRSVPPCGISLAKIRQKMPPRPLHKPERLCYDKAEKSVWQSQPQGDVLDV